MTPRCAIRTAAAGTLALLLVACTSFQPAREPAGVPVAPATPRNADLAQYFELLDQLAPGDPARQAAAYDAALAAVQAEPTASRRLEHALALGAPGHDRSNPVEARRLIAELLAGANDLQPPEVALANAFLREYDARVALYAELSRQREEAERRLQALDTDGDRRVNALNAENQRLRKQLAEAERKLEAVAEMEQALAPGNP
jgi:hypothetical protein